MSEVPTDGDVRVEVDERGVARVSIDRPAKRNAFHPALMGRIRDAVERVGAADDVRVVVLAGEGAAFSGGADIVYMRSLVDASVEENIADARRLDGLFHAIESCPKPVVARVQGPALGGAMGLICCADLVVAAQDAVFGFSEVRVGIAPAVISTYVLPRLGLGQARRWLLTGERFGADVAKRVGLVHEVCAPEDLDDAVEGMVQQVLAGSPAGQAATKALLRQVQGADRETAVGLTTRTIAALRAGPDGQEGLGAFLERRLPSWHPDAPG